MDLMRRRLHTFDPCEVIFAKYDYGWPTPASPIPKLEIPAAPPAPTEPPESPSIQLLRNMLRDRRDEKRVVELAKQSRTAKIVSLEAQVVDLRSRNDQDDRHIDAASTAIADILADIAKLGGREEG